MKIIHVTIGKASSERMNGVNKVVDALASQMILKGQDVEVWGMTPTPQAATTERSYPLRLFSLSRNPFHQNKHLRQAIDELPPQTIVHFHSVFAPPYYRMAKQLKGREIPWIVTPHGALLPSSLRRRFLVKKLYQLFFDKYVLQGAIFLHAITPDEQKALQVWGASLVISNAAEPRVFMPSSPDRLIFGYVGRLDAKHKGLDLLLEGFRQYWSAGGRGELWLVGDGSDKASLKRQASDNVVFWGARFNQEKENLIRQMSAFIHTSRWDVMPTAVLEAASFGKPLLLSSETGMADWNAKWQSGLNLEQNNPEGIASALKSCEDLHASGQLEKMGRNAAKMIEDELNWSSAADQIISRLYKI